MYLASGVIGTMLMVWNVIIYRSTMIKAEYLIGIVLIIGGIGLLFDRKNYNKTYGLKGSYVWAFFQNIISWGFIFCSLFLVSNYYFSSEEVLTSEHRITARSSMRAGKKASSKERPLVEIIYKQEVKELVFSSKFLKSIDDYKYVELEMAMGLFGIEVIKGKSLRRGGD